VLPYLECTVGLFIPRFNWKGGWWSTLLNLRGTRQNMVGRQSVYWNRELVADKTQLIQMLETLAKIDETVVREQVGHKMWLILSLQNLWTQLHLLLQMLRFKTLWLQLLLDLELVIGSLAESQPAISSKMYTQGQAHRRRSSESIWILLSIRKFVELCNEDTPMVRRAGASKIGVRWITEMLVVCYTSWQSTCHFWPSTSHETTILGWIGLD
jgi:hypothetical protein